MVFARQNAIGHLRGFCCRGPLGAIQVRGIEQFWIYPVIRPAVMVGVHVKMYKHAETLVDKSPLQGIEREGLGKERSR